MASVGALGWMQGAGSFLQAWGAVEAGRAARIRGQRSKAAAEFHAWQAEQKAGVTLAISQRQAEEERRQLDLVASRALAVSAASGAGVSDPTIVRLLARVKGEGVYRASVALYEGEAQARQLRLEAQAARVRGAEAEAEGRAAEFGHRLSALGSLVGGGSSLFARYGAGGPGSGDSATIDV